MSRGDSGTFLFDPEAWRGSVRVQRMGATERGLYFEMLIQQWLKGSAPGTPEACADAIGVEPVEVWRAAWPKLAKCFRARRNGVLVNDRIEQTRKNKLAYLAGQAERGRLGGKAAQAKKLARKRRLSGARPTLKQNQAYGVGLGGVGLGGVGLGGVGLGLEDQNKISGSRRDALATAPADDRNFAVIEKIAHEILDHYPDAPIPDQVEAVKELCSKRRIDYRSDVVQRAIDSALVQRGAHA